MCGILAYYKKGGLSKKEVQESLDSLQIINHRGPDGEGVVLINTKTNCYKLLKTKDTPAKIETNLHFENIVDFEFDLLLGHRRLSIFDLSEAGHQPMKGTENSWITYNGEVYNFQEIKDTLILKGYRFNTGTDTEVILHAYREWGEKCLNLFNGMWSFILWDGDQQKLVISNDRFGVKPLYYYENSQELLLFSETKQILAFPNRVTKYNLEKINTFVESGYLDYDADTFFEQVFRFPKSNIGYFHPSKDQKINFLQYYKLKTDKTSISFDDAKQKFRHLLTDSISLRLNGDVEPGVAVSGGLDSSSIIYLTNKILGIKNIKTFSAVFPGEFGDESHFIDIIIKDLGLQSNKIDALTTFNYADFSKHIYHQDFPAQSTSFYAQWLVDRLTAEKGVKIFLNGQGADEVFGGYHHHFYKYCKSLIVKGKIIKYLSEVKTYAHLKKWDTNKVHRAVIADLKLATKFFLLLKKKDSCLASRWNNAKDLCALLKIDFEEAMIPTYLRVDDRNGMAFSIESRHPFMDYRLVEFGFSLPDEFKIKNGWQKYIIRNAIFEMPDSIRWRKDKKGFVSPQEKWISENKLDFQSHLGLLKNVGIEKQDNFKNYSLATWLKHNQLF